MKDNEKIVWIVVALAVLLFLGGFGMMGFGSYGYGGVMGMMYGSYGIGAMFFGWLYGLLILTALVLFIIWLVKKINPDK